MNYRSSDSRDCRWPKVFRACIRSRWTFGRDIFCSVNKLRDEEREETTRTVGAVSVSLSAGTTAERWLWCKTVSRSPSHSLQAKLSSWPCPISYGARSHHGSVIRDHIWAICDPAADMSLGGALGSNFLIDISRRMSLCINCGDVAHFSLLLETRLCKVRSTITFTKNPEIHSFAYFAMRKKLGLPSYAERRLPDFTCLLDRHHLMLIWRCL